MDYQIVYLGGGPGGYEGAIAAAKKGLKTAVIEMGSPGGTCLHRGCIPTKALLHAVKSIKQIKAATKMGVKIEGNINVDLNSLKKYKERVVNKLNKGIEFLFQSNGVELIKGKGTIINKKTILVENEEGKKELTSENIVISTGSIPSELPFLKIDKNFIISSNEALELKEIPKKMLVVGAGAIGLEMGLIYSYLGSAVTIVEIMENIVPGSDSQCAKILENELKKQKIKILTKTSIESYQIDKEKKEIKVNLKGEKKESEETFNTILSAVGRKPYHESAFDKEISIKTDKRGYIEVDENYETSVKRIFACGDVVGQPLLAHKASHEACMIANYIATGEKFNLPPVPAAVFTFPEYASIGINEDQAKEKDIPHKVATFPYSAGSRSNAIDDKTGLVKLIANEDNILIGAHIVGSDAGELLTLLSYAMSKNINVKDFHNMIFMHPTLSENLKEALGVLGGFSIHI